MSTSTTVTPAAPGRAAVVGGGTMGTGVATAFYRHGWTVDVVEPDARARDSLLARIDLLLPEPVGTARIAQRVRAHARLDQVDWQGVDFVSESAFEELAVKREVFEQLVRLAPPGIPLTSNSTTLFVADIARGLGRDDSVVNVHFLMPAHAVPLVEVVATPEASPQVIDRTWSILLSAGKVPVRLNQAMVGFLANRIQSALMREALALIDEGVASAEDVDTAVRYSFGFRYAACGPLLQKEHSGWDLSYKMYQAVFPTLANNAEPPRVIGDLIAKGHFGMKTGRGLVEWPAELMQRERARFNRRINDAMNFVLDQSDHVPIDWK